MMQVSKELRALPVVYKETRVTKGDGCVVTLLWPYLVLSQNPPHSKTVNESFLRLIIVTQFAKQICKTEPSELSLLGDSGGVVNSLDFCPASLKSLGCFYFRCVLSSQSKAVTVNFTLPTLKAFLEARNHNVSGNKQELVSRAIGCPKTHFFYEHAIFWSAKKQCKDTFFPSSIPFPQ